MVRTGLRSDIVQGPKSGDMHFGFEMSAAASAATATPMPRDSTSDLALSDAPCLWLIYGVAKDDWVNVLANSIGATLALAVLGVQNSRLEFMIPRRR